MRRCGSFIRNQVESARLSGSAYYAGEEKLMSRTLLPRFYQARAYKTIWIDANGLKKEAGEVMSQLGQAASEGLNPADYHGLALQRLLEQLKEKKTVGHLAQIELLLTDAYLVYGAHLYYGKLNPSTAQPEWKAERKSQELVLDTYLAQAVEGGTVESSLEKLSPQQVEYRKLKKALHHYRQLEKEDAFYAPIPGGVSIKKGDSDVRIGAIRNRLVQTRDLSDARLRSDVYDEELEQVVKNFQARHGLRADGVIGEGTLRALNMTLEERIRKIEINMERWRWLPASLGKEYIMVNIPNFRLTVMSGDSSALDLTAIVGKYQRKTPVFSGRMTYMVLNPSWTVPPTILENDILPELRKSTDILKKKNLRVLTLGGAEVNPATVDWSKVKASNCPYIFRQEPGETNALGVVKFIFPNEYNVYIHDTPTKDLFGKEERAFSSGCIRLQNPMNLAYHLLRDSPKWKPEAINKLLESKKEQTIMLPNPLSVHFLYLTSWAEKDGALVHFRKDIYDRDEAILHGLKVSAPLI